jgi:hypothetical protein
LGKVNDVVKIDERDWGCFYSSREVFLSKPIKKEILICPPNSFYKKVGGLRFEVEE